jgi:RNA polymerase sigma-70 factor (ECF subfamily)
MKLSRTQAKKLVKGCVANNRTDQETLYKMFHGDMLRVCYTYLPDKELAREAFNTAFLKVFQSIKNFDAEEGELGGWIRKIMIHTSIDLCRKELKFRQMADSNEMEDQIFIDPSVLDKLYFEDILSEIRTLPFATRTVFNLYVLDGYSHKEIGEQLDINEATSRWHLSDAKKRLKERLGNLPAERRNKTA